MASLSRPPLIASFSPLKRAPRPMATAGRPSGACAPSSLPVGRKLPVLLFDIMDTVVRDPFYEDVPAFFRMPMKDLLEHKHPTAWMEFEKGLIDELKDSSKMGDLLNWKVRITAQDRRHAVLEGLKECMKRGYWYVDGIEDLLQDLKRSNYEMHAFTNYPIWYLMIEEKLRISTYLSWTFCSCTIGKLKPASDLYLEVCERLGVDPACCVFIDDRVTNVEAAVGAGMVGLHFRGASTLREDLSLLGIQIDAIDADKSIDIQEEAN